MITVSFKEVGREKASWTEDFPKLDHDSLYKSVKKKARLMSSNIDFAETEKEGEGVILVGGFRPVGKFTFCEVAG